MIRRNAAIALSIFALLLTAAVPQAPACPSCKSTLTGEEMLDRARLDLEIAAMTSGMDSDAARRALDDVAAAEGNLARTRGYFWSILFMMVAPFTLMGILALVMTRAFRKAAVARDAALAAQGQQVNP